ncbi:MULTISPECIES: pyridoxal-phosphate dependent enzyme [unclassified Chelatococcus]|uniref:threonine synthase n=1 Tax=unclassified Chelatococcus TaxID=2638111 RepID=UPI001BCCFF02|nr:MULTISPECIES: pyridoxal-phosphate dependent enzyme [unclassified Chelatococcus]MBS7700410.1 pyridoxal-phosphate dependent enzyme [Chelatococcus sp. YT9]MBX3556206.1 pyridoxal-phosphate dependent enzyme [Chelatococcus sp.]
MQIINTHLSGFKCIRCSTQYPVDDYQEGCPRCLTEAHPASVVPIYGNDLSPPFGERAGRGLARFGKWLPYTMFASLGEGDTPLVDLPRLAAQCGLEALSIKLESANPTGSHKDRMSAQFVARAKDRNAPSVIAASSGNAGCSVAAYAAAAGLPCTIVTTPAITAPWRRAIEMTGASIVYVEDSLERWDIVKRKVYEEGYLSATNYLVPPVGSDPYGVEGYKTLGYELAEDPAVSVADAIFVPTARGDLLWGIYRGLVEAVEARRLAVMPKLVAVEPFPRLERVLAGQDVRSQFPGKTLLASIGGATVTYQSWLAVARSGGTAVSVAESDVLEDQQLLARHGHYLELSAAAALTGLRKLAASPDVGPRIRRAVLIGTSHGYKEAAE